MLKVEEILQIEFGYNTVKYKKKGKIKTCNSAVFLTIEAKTLLSFLLYGDC